MTILNRIIADKYKEIALKKSLISIPDLTKSVLFERKTYSLTENLRRSANGIIAEHKRRSPSKSVINQDLNCFDVVEAYEEAGVAGISVLTDGKYFGGSLDDLLVARAKCSLPLLRKDFVIDPYQIYEAKAYGADVVLLIAAVLNPFDIKRFAEIAKSLQLEILLEVYDLNELQRSIVPDIDMIGVNNRNLNTFEVTLQTSELLATEIPNDFIKVSESGISSANDVLELKKFGYQGFLIGENFMKTDLVYAETKKFVNQIEKQK